MKRPAYGCCRNGPGARLAAASSPKTALRTGGPGREGSSQLDPKRPIEAELQASVPDGFSAVAVGDLIISRPLSQHASSCRLSAPSLEILRGTDVTFGNLETTIFDPRTFEGAPYSWDGDWTNASVPAVASDLKAMGFDIVGRANNHSQDWGLEGHARDRALARRSRHRPCRRRRIAPDGARTRLLREPAGPHRRRVVRLDVPADERVAAAGRDRAGPAGT